MTADKQISRLVLGAVSQRIYGIKLNNCLIEFAGQKHNENIVDLPINLHFEALVLNSIGIQMVVDNTHGIQSIIKPCTLIIIVDTLEKQ